MPWTVGQLREYRQYPQSDAVIARAMVSAAADVDSINSNLVDTNPILRDQIIDQLVYLDLGMDSKLVSSAPLGPQVESNRMARNAILRKASRPFEALDDGRRRVYPPRYPV